MIWCGPKLKFKRSQVSLEDAAALLVENWGGDRWGYIVRCSPFDYYRKQRRAPQTVLLLNPLIELAMRPPTIPMNPNEDSGYARFMLRPCDEVPEGEVWLMRSL